MKASLELAGLRVEISSEDSSLFSLLRKRYTKFITNHVRPSARIMVSLSPGLSFLEEGSWGEEFRVEIDRREDEVEVYSYHFRGGFDFRTRSGRLEADCNEALGSLDNYLRVIGASLLLQEGGILIHAAGVKRKRQGCLFPGPSGAGKSTIAASLAFKGEVLGDDLIAIRDNGKGWTMHSVPMQGEKNFPCVKVGLHGIFFPEKDSGNYLSTISRSDAMAFILSDLPFLSEEERKSAVLLSRCEKLVKSVPIYRLHFKKGRGGALWALLRRTLR